MGRGADQIEEVGCFRAERYGSLVEVMERTGGYRLTLYGQHDIDVLRKLLDRIEQREEYQPVLTLDERGRASA